MTIWLVPGIIMFGVGIARTLNLLHMIRMQLMVAIRKLVGDDVGAIEEDFMRDVFLTKAVDTVPGGDWRRSTSFIASSY